MGGCTTICLSENTEAVVDEGHAVAGGSRTRRARRCGHGLFPRGRVGTHLALEEGLLHLWNQLGCPDHHATDGDEPIGISARRREGGLSQLGGLPKVWVCCPALEDLAAGRMGMLEPRWRRCGQSIDTSLGTLSSGLGRPPVSSRIPLNPSSLLTCTKLSWPKAAWGRSDSMTWLQQPMCL